MLDSYPALDIAKFVAKFFQDVVHYAHYFAAKLAIHFGPRNTALFQVILMEQFVIGDQYITGVGRALSGKNQKFKK